MKWVLSILLLFNGHYLCAQTDYWSYQVYFSGCPINHIPKGITIPDKDKESRAIINAIIDGYSYDQLQQQYSDSLDIKLEKLISGKVIERNQDSFRLLFPVLVGENRTKLQTIIRKQLSESELSIDTMILALKHYLSKNPEMVFHFLWSRIIDDCWWDLYNSTFQTEKGPPSIAFIVYPPHPFQCGTNSDYSFNNDMFAMSWSYNIFNESFKVPSTKSFFNLATRKSIPKSDHEFFVKHGLIDSEDHALIYTYYEDDSLDRLCDSLKMYYINTIKGLFNYDELSKIFQLPADDLFILVSHEIAYELIEMINERNLVFVPITSQNNQNLSLRYLVSIRFHKQKD